MTRTTPESAKAGEPPVGRRARKALAARNALFAAGLAAFARQPIGMVSVLDITEAADAAKGVFYLHFASKDDYLLSLLADTHRKLLDVVAANAERGRSEASRREAAILAMRRFALEQPHAARFLVRMDAYFPDEVGLPGELAKVRRAYRRRLASILAARECGEDDAALRQAVTLDAACRGLIGAAMRNGQEIDPEPLFLKSVQGMLRSR